MQPAWGSLWALYMMYGNLLPEEYLRNIGYEKLARFFLLTYIGVGISIVVGAILLLPSFFFLTFQESGVLEQITIAKQSIEAQRIEQMETIILDTNQKLTTLTTSTGYSRAPATTYIEHIASHLPATTRITSFALLPNSTITLKGDADTRDALLIFVDNLRADSLFSSVESPITNILKERTVTYILTITL
jgi:Tfp pilus assembly protein PilN